MKRFYFLNFLRKNVTYGFKIWNQLAIKIYTRLWVRAKIFCCYRNGALSEKLHCYRKIVMVTKKTETS
jgi:hypothetical protein